MEITSTKLRLDYRIIGVKQLSTVFQFYYGKCRITEIVKVVTDIIAGLTMSWIELFLLLIPNTDHLQNCDNVC
jgi:hypothetical protein